MCCARNFQSCDTGRIRPCPQPGVKGRGVLAVALGQGPGEQALVCVYLYINEIVDTKLCNSF